MIARKRLVSYIYDPLPAIELSDMIVVMNSIAIEPNQQIAVDQTATLRCNPTEPKTCIHPLYSPAGRILSGFEPSDHRWHRGLWFTLKFVDNDNFWEEDEKTGSQVSSKHPQVLVDDEGSYTVEQEIFYRRPNGEDVIREQRILRIERDEVAVRVDWNGKLEFLSDAHIDRTPFQGWGGYAGLGLRTTRELHDVRFLSPEGEHEAVLGDHIHGWRWMVCWMDLS